MQVQIQTPAERVADEDGTHAGEVQDPVRRDSKSAYVRAMCILIIHISTEILLQSNVILSLLIFGRTGFSTFLQTVLLCGCISLMFFFCVC